MSKAKPTWVWALVIVAAAALLRALFPAADAPGYLDTTGFLVTDEGWYAGEAARHVLGLPSFPADLNTVVHTPLFHLWSLLAYRLMGVSLIGVRLLNVLAGCATVAALAWICRADRRVGLLAAGLLALDYTHLMFSRIGGAEPLQALLATLALAAYVAAERRPWLHLAGVALAFGAGLVKTNGMVFVGVYLLAEALRLFGEREGLRELIGSAVRRLFLPGVAAAALVTGWVLLWVRPNYTAWQVFNAHTVTSRLPEDLGRLAKNLTGFLLINPLAQYSFLLAALGLCGLTVALVRLWRRESVPRYASFASAWVLLMTAMIMPYNYQPERYFVVYLPALAVLSAYAAAGAGQRAPMRLLAGLTLWVFITQAVQGRLLWAALALLFLGAATYMLAAFREQPRRIAPGLVLLAAAVLAAPYARWALDLRYTVVEVGQAVGERVRSEAKAPCLLGNAAGTLALVNHLPTLTTTYGDMAGKWEQCRPTHVLVSGREEQKLLAMVPGLAQNLEEMGLYYIYENYDREPWPGEKLYRVKPGFVWPAH